MGAQITNMDRGTFCKGAAAAAGACALGAAALGAGAGLARADERSWNYEADVVVAGAGLGGLTAAIRCAQEGKNVVVVEVSRTSGGGSAFSGGCANCAFGMGDFDSYWEYCEGLHERELAQSYFDNFMKWNEWVRTIGAAISNDNKIQGVNDNMISFGSQPGAGIHGDREFFLSLEDALAGFGGTLLFETQARKIITDEAGTVVGLHCTNADGSVDIKAPAVIIATGGWQANPEWRLRYLGNDADMCTIMASPHSTGDGIMMAQEVGAALSGAFGSFGASLGSAYPGYRSPCEDVDLYESLDYTDEGKYRLNTMHVTFPPQKALLLNLEGKRFVNESEIYYRVHMAMARQRHATGVYVFDQDYYDEFAEEPDVLYDMTFVDQVEMHKEYGGKGLIKADTIEELADKLAEAPWNMPRGTFLRTVSEWNAACDEGATGDLDIPYQTAVDPATGKPRSATKCVTGPFYAWCATPAIYTTFGGLSVDADMHVLDAQKKPISGLYACAPAAGGIIREIYTGGMGLAASTAYRVALSVLGQ